MASILRLIFLLLLWLHVSLGYILRLPCKTHGNFSVEKLGFMLTGHVLASLEVSTVDLCEQHCLYHQSCSSINWKTPTSGSANCQINEKSTENSDDNVKLSPSSEWTYKTTDYRNRNVGELCRGRNPCPIGHRCTDSCSCPGFQCQNVTTEARSCKDLYDLGFRKSTRYDIYRPEIGIFPHTDFKRGIELFQLLHWIHTQSSSSHQQWNWIVFISDYQHHVRICGQTRLGRECDEGEQNMGCALRLIFLLLLWLHVSLGYILRLPCKTYGNFSVEKSGFRLDGHVLVSLEVSTVELCEQHCLYHQSCSSINWKTPASGSANCQINEKSTENLYENVKLSPSSEWTYKTTDYRNTNKQEVARIFTTLASEKVRDMTSIDQKLEFSHDGGLAKYMSWKAIKNEYGKVTFSEMKVMFS
eukprot:gene511-10191_t